MSDEYIGAIKYLRQATHLPLKDAKHIVDLVQARLTAQDLAPITAQMDELRRETERHRTAMAHLILMVDYFVAHPEAYAAWKEAAR